MVEQDEKNILRIKKLQKVLEIHLKVVYLQHRKITLRGRAVGVLVCLISRRSAVRVRPPLPSKGTYSKIDFLYYGFTQKFTQKRLFLVLIIGALVQRPVY